MIREGPVRRGARAWSGRAGRVAAFAVALHAAGAGALVTAGDLRLPGQARALAISEGIAWVVTLDPRIDPNQPLPCPCPPASLQAFRVSDPRHPEELGVLAGLADPRAVEVAGGIAYVIESAGLVLIDVSDPTHPVELSRVTSVGRAYDVAVAGSFVYVGSSTGLTVIDVSDPRSPVEVGALEEPASLVEVRDGFVYLVGSDGSGGRLSVVDVSDPAAPGLVGSLDTGRSPTALSVEGGVWIAEDVSRLSLPRSLLRAIDVSDPTAPIEVGVFEEDALIDDVELSGTIAYLAGSSGVHAIDVSDPAAPVGLGALATSGLEADLEIAGGFAHVAAGFSLRTLDLAEPGFPTELGALELKQRTISDVEVVGERAYVASNAFFSPLLSAGVLTVVDASDPAAPRELGRVAVPGLADEVEVQGGRAWVAGRFSGIRVFDVSDPTAPAEIGSLAIPDVTSNLTSGVSDLQAAGERLYLTWTDFFLSGGGFRAIDLAARTSRGKGARDLVAPARGVEMVGDLAYLAERNGLRVIDASRPTALVERGSLELSGAIDVEVDLGFAYLTSNSPPNVFPPRVSALHTVDVSAASALRPAARLELPPSVGEVEVADGFAYVVTAPFRLPSFPGSRSRPVSLRAIDVSDPAHLEERGALPVPSGGSLEVAGGRVYLGGGSTLRILDFGPEYRAVSPAAIDVKPGDARNALDPRGRGSVGVAILGGEGLDVRTVDRRSFAFGPADAPAARSVGFKDVDRDGFTDLVAHFLKRHTGLAPGDAEACLRGKLLDGTRFEGCDAIRTPSPR